MEEISIYYDCHQERPGHPEQMCIINMGNEQGRRGVGGVGVTGCHGGKR